MKYIIVDLDDTFLDSKKRISEYSIDVINRLKKKGFIFVFNSARSYLSAMPYMRQIRPTYSILNGGVTFVGPDLQIFEKLLIDKDTANLILEDVKTDKNVINYSVQSDSGLYSKDYRYIEKNKLCMYKSFTSPLDEGAYKILLMTENKSKWDKIARENDLEYESYLNGLWGRICRSNKYKGNLRLFELLHDDNPEDYVFGDDTGDKEMVDNAYHGVYLKNSNKLVLKDAKRVTKYDNDHDGVCRYLEELFLKED